MFTNGLRVTSKDGVLVFTVSTWRQIWETMVEGIETNKWYLVEVDWHPQGDLKVRHEDNCQRYGDKGLYHGDNCQHQMITNGTLLRSTGIPKAVLR